VLLTLIDGGEVFRHSPLTRAGKPKYALYPADPIAYFAKDLDKLLAAVAKKGFAPAAVRAAALLHLGATTGESDANASSSPLTTDAILATMRRLEPRVESGAAVSIARLRDAVGAHCGKATFDTAVLSLANSLRPNEHPPALRCAASVKIAPARD